MKSPNRDTNAFTLVEVTLAIAVVAIGLVGILALFPLGFRSTRQASDNTEMAINAQWLISDYQMMALATNNYDNTGTPAKLLFDDWYSTAFTNNGVIYTADVTVTNEGFPQLTANNQYLLSRVTIRMHRPGSHTNVYITDVARYIKN